MLEEAWLVEHRLPFVRLQALELGEEIVKLLRPGGIAKEDLDIDERPAAPAASSQPVWLTAAAPERTWLNLWMQIDGCLVRKAQVDVHFAQKKGFMTVLAQEIDTPWVR